MKYHRNERIASLIKEELNNLILREVEFSGAVVTIVDIEVSEDLDKALVKIAVFPNNKGPDALVALENHRRKLQFLLMRKMNIKPMPKLVFKLDITEEEKEVAVPG